MLAADKLQLQSALKQQAVALKEKEFNLHHSNLMTVGTQAAVLAGLDITMFIEFQPADDSEWGDAWGDNGIHVCRILKFIYYGVIVAAFCANMMVVSQTTVLSVLGAGLALRGPDGSMMVATEALYDERLKIFSIFGWGLALTVSSVLVSVWLLLKWEAAVLCWGIAVFTCYSIFTNYHRVRHRLEFDERDTVDFRDLMSVSSGITPFNATTSTRQSSANSNNNGRTKVSSRQSTKTFNSQSSIASGFSCKSRRQSQGSSEEEVGFVAADYEDDEEEDVSFYSYADDQSYADDVEMQQQQQQSLLRGSAKRRGKNRPGMMSNGNGNNNPSSTNIQCV